MRKFNALEVRNRKEPGRLPDGGGFRMKLQSQGSNAGCIVIGSMISIRCILSGSILMVLLMIGLIGRLEILQFGEIAR